MSTSSVPAGIQTEENGPGRSRIQGRVGARESTKNLQEVFSAPGGRARKSKSRAGRQNRSPQRGTAGQLSGLYVTSTLHHPHRPASNIVTRHTLIEQSANNFSFSCGSSGRIRFIFVLVFPTRKTSETEEGVDDAIYFYSHDLVVTGAEPYRSPGRTGSRSNDLGHGNGCFRRGNTGRCGVGQEQR